MKILAVQITRKYEECTTTFFIFAFFMYVKDLTVQITRENEEGSVCDYEKM